MLKVEDRLTVAAFDVVAHSSLSQVFTFAEGPVMSPMETLAHS